MKAQKDTSRSFLQTAKAAWLKFWHSFRRILHETKVSFLASFTKWADPKLEKYRTPDMRRFTPASPKHTPAPSAEITEVKSSAKNLTPDHTQHTAPEKPYTPKSITEFLDIMKRTPRSVLDSRERHVIATIMNFPSVRVSEIMLPPSAITYVNDDEVIGPLVLDRLYKSGYQHFPVIDGRHRIIGLIHTTALNSLEIKQTNHAREILDPKVYYLRQDYTLNQALAAFLRTNCYFFLVVDRYERIVGMLTYQMLIDYLLGETPSDKFDRDSDRLAVAKRKL